MLARAAARLAPLKGTATASAPSLSPAVGLLSRALGSTPVPPASSGNDPAPGSQQRSAGAAPSASPQGVPPPVLPASQQQLLPQQHWLDSYFPGLRHWLEDQNRKWWIKGLVQARCKQYHQLEGRELKLRRLIEAEYVAAMRQHGGRAVDERSETHLQVAALVLATHKTLLPWLRDEQEVLQIIREHMGGRTQALLRFLMTATRFMQRDGYATLAARLRGLQWDMGAGFDSQLQMGDTESSLTITRCFYHDAFAAAGHPQLAGACCCSLDTVWFETPYRGVHAARTAAISAGDDHCCFLVRRQQPGGQQQQPRQQAEP